jgi:DNA repair photolyase
MTPVLFPELTEPETAPDVAPVPEGRKLDLEGLRARTALVRQKLVRQKTDPGRPGGRWFDWSANPYRGCEFDCGYCYARYSHGYLGHDDAAEFGTKIYVKEGFVAALKRDLLKRVKPGEHVAIGTATDPYQPIEKRELVMQRALHALLQSEGLRISITTKAALVARDAELLARVAERHALHVNFSITTVDARLARFLEPRAPAPEKRLEALTTLRRHGVSAGVFMMPLLPGVTDADADIERLMRACAGAGALWLGSQVVFLREPSRGHFLRKLRLSYPRVAARYAWWTKTNARLPHQIRDEAVARVRRFATKHGLSSRPDLDRPTPRRRQQATFAFSGEI